MTELRHHHKACVGCIHERAHGLWDGFSLAVAVLMKAGYPEAVVALEAQQRRAVNASVRKVGRNIDRDELRTLMRHHGAARGR